MSRSAMPRRSRRPRRCWRANAGTDGPMCRCSAAASTLSAPTARANCSIAPAKAASMCSFSPADRSTARATSIWSEIGDHAHPEGALPRLVRLGLSLLRGAESDPVPHRAFAPHAGAAGRFHQRAGRERRQRLPPRRTDRAGHQPLPVLASPTDAFTLASVHPGHTVEEVIEHTGFDFDRAGRGAGNAGALARDAQADARGGGAAARRGLSAVRRAGFWRRPSRPYELKIYSDCNYLADSPHCRRQPLWARRVWHSVPPRPSGRTPHNAKIKRNTSGETS